MVNFRNIFLNVRLSLFFHPTLQLFFNVQTEIFCWYLLEIQMLIIRSELVIQIFSKRSRDFNFLDLTFHSHDTEIIAKK